MPVSIKDIARIAGVSHSTVSRALAHNELVNPVTRARIQALAVEMGYSPNAQARGLVSGHTMTVGVVVTTIDDPFVAEVMQGIESTAHLSGYTVILASSNSEPERELRAVEMLQSKRVDAVIVTSSGVGARYREHLERFGVPVVLINNHVDEHRYTFSVGVDNLRGAISATQHLIGQGHHRIGYVAAPADANSNAERFAGYCQALRAAGLPVDPDLIVTGTGKAPGGERALTTLLHAGARPNALFCYNDMTAIGVLRAARAAGLAVPEELSVVGFDDIPFASYCEPPLTTIAQPKLEMGQQAMQMAFTLMTKDKSEEERVCNITVQGRLIIRQSTQKVEHQS
jgi:DNA-binding LacI/PurR family transcriptional regulator